MQWPELIVKWVAVGTPVARHPRHRPIRALINAYGYYLGMIAACQLRENR